jgi:hypothetical protein
MVIGRAVQRPRIAVKTRGPVKLFQLIWLRCHGLLSRFNRILSQERRLQSAEPLSNHALPDESGVPIPRRQFTHWCSDQAHRHFTFHALTM